MAYNNYSDYQVPQFSRPIQSPDFKTYIERPIRKRFLDSEIWPMEYAAHRAKVSKNRVFRWTYKYNYKYKFPSYHHREKICPCPNMISY